MNEEIQKSIDAENEPLNVDILNCEIEPSASFMSSVAAAELKLRRIDPLKLFLNGEWYDGTFAAVCGHHSVQNRIYCLGLDGIFKHARCYNTANHGYRVSIRGSKVVRFCYYSAHSKQPVPFQDENPFEGCVDTACFDNANVPEYQKHYFPCDIVESNNSAEEQKTVAGLPVVNGMIQLNRKSNSSLRRTYRNAESRLECMDDPRRCVMVTLTYRPVPLEEDVEVRKAFFYNCANEVVPCKCLVGCNTGKVYNVGALFDIDPEKHGAPVMGRHGKTYTPRLSYPIDEFNDGDVLHAGDYMLPFTDFDVINDDLKKFIKRFEYKFGKNCCFCCAREPQKTGNWHIHLLIYFPSFYELDKHGKEHFAPYIKKSWIVENWTNADPQCIDIALCSSEKKLAESFTLIRYLISYLKKRTDRIRFYPRGKSPITFSDDFPRPYEFICDKQTRDYLWHLLTDVSGFVYDSKASYSVKTEQYFYSEYRFEKKRDPAFTFWDSETGEACISPFDTYVNCKIKDPNGVLPESFEARVNSWREDQHLSSEIDRIEAQLIKCLKQMTPEEIADCEWFQNLPIEEKEKYENVIESES